MIELLNPDEDDVLAIRASDKLTKEDYDRLMPLVDQRLQEKETLRMLVHLENWRGWDSLAAVWEDARMIRVAGRIERLAMVGEENWQRWTANIADLLTRGEVRYFNPSQMDDAWQWLRNRTD